MPDIVPCPECKAPTYVVPDTSGGLRRILAGAHSEALTQRERAEKAAAALVQTRAALASLIASVHVAAMRGWHHTQIASVEEAADHAQSALPEGSASDSVSHDTEEKKT